MKNLRRVVWSKGMLLTPQHFQAQEAFLEDRLQFRFQASHFANWGVTELAIDQASLANGLLVLRHCRGVLPDGLVFSIPATDDPPDGRAMAEHFPPTQETLDVYLAVPEQRPQGKNVTPAAAQSNGPENQATTRYVTDTRSIVDETGGVEERPVQFARKNFRLLFGGESLDGSTALRVAQITRNTAGILVLQPEFIAPCLNIASSEYLMMMLRRQIEILAAKSSSLAAPRRQRSQSLADFTTSDVAGFWLLHTVNSYMPELQHIWTVRRGHPEPLFAAMLRLAGALSTFSLEGHPRDLPPYDHDNLGACFTALDGRIRLLLETVIPAKCVPIPLRLTDKLIWSGTVAEDHYFKNSQFFLAVSARMGVDDLIKKVPQLVKLSSSSEIQRLVRNALPGVTLRHAPAPPAAIPLKLDNQYFSLNQSGIVWEGINKSRSVSLFVPGELVDPKMELLVVLE